MEKQIAIFLMRKLVLTEFNLYFFFQKLLQKPSKLDRVDFEFKGEISFAITSPSGLLIFFRIFEINLNWKLQIS